MARRKVALEKLRAQGPVLLVDAGNALFRAPLVADPIEKEKAEFLLRTMARLGTVAMPAGMRDLSAGLEFLKATAAAAGVRVLSVNLRAHGKAIFPASSVGQVGAVKVGLIGVSPVGKFPGAPEVEGAPAIQPTVSEARRLKKKVDLVVALCAIPYADVLQLSKEAGDSVDLILQSHDARGAGIAQRQGQIYVIPTGDRGRQLGELALDLSGKGSFFDLSEIERTRQMVERLEQQITETERRLNTAVEPSVQEALHKSLESFEARKKTLETTPMDAGGHKTLSLNFVDLGPEVADDPALQAQIAKYGESNAGK